jgi:hypothetical protein
MRRIMPWVVAVAVTGAAGGVFAQQRPAPPAAGDAALAATFEKLAAQDFAEREQAVAAVQQLIMKQMRQSIALQQVVLKLQQDLAAQLRLLTGRAEPQGAGGPGGTDPETVTRVAGLLEFTGSVARWAGDAMALPDEKRDAMLKWGSQDAVMPLLGQLYSRSVDTRIAAVRALAKLPDGKEQAAALLTDLLNDPERGVSLTAMDVISALPPTPAGVEALWNRAVSNLQAQVRGGGGRQARTRQVTVAGRTIQVVDNEAVVNRGSADADVAVDVLVKWKDPQVAARLDDFFREAGRTVATNNNWRMLTPSYNSEARGLMRLVGAYKSREAVNFFAKLLDANDGSTQTMSLNNVQWRMSGRIDAAAMLLRATGQAPGDYDITNVPNYGTDRLGMRGTEVEEEAMVKKVKAWWKDHAKEYETSDKPAEQGATRDRTP